MLKITLDKKTLKVIDVTPIDDIEFKVKDVAKILAPIADQIISQQTDSEVV